MNLATLLVALIATSAADTTGDPVLLDFTATWCGPCQQMKPAVEKLVEMGYPVKQVDYDRSPDLVRRYNVTAVPTFLVVDARGQVLARTQGLMPAGKLAAFYNTAKLKAAADDPGDDAEAPDEPEAAPSGPSAAAPLVNPNPWETVVRIKMHLSDREWGYGSGTIIYSSAEESIILTCAHIFKVRGGNQPTPANFRVPISVDLFGGQFVRRQPSAMLACTQPDLPGEAIDYDFTNDVGLIRIRPGRKLPASRVVPAYWKPQKGMAMTTVGCSHGDDATAWSTTILEPRLAMSNTATQKSFATIKCAYQPKEGRSGGGLYTSDGYVAGVCDFADPSEHVGLYAVPEAIHRLLDRNQLTALYKAPEPGGAMLASTGRAKARPSASTGTKVRAQNPDDEITLPHPSLAGINAPPADARPWRTRGDDRSAPGGIRRPAQTDVALADPVDRGARPGEAQPTDQTSEPGAEARSLHDIEEPPAAPVPPPAKPATNRPKGSGWRPVRKPSADQDGVRTSAP